MQQPSPTGNPTTMLQDVPLQPPAKSRMIHHDGASPLCSELLCWNATEVIG
ncbi:MAG TPA: hypothetical protein VGG81_03360 [Edaphobacter sp.]